MWRRRHCCVGATLRRRFDELVTSSLRLVPNGHAVLPQIPTMSTTDIKGNAEFPLICSLGVPAILIENVLTPSFFMVVYTNMNKILHFSLFSDGNIKNINICWDPLTPCNIWRTVATRKIYILGLLDRTHDVRIRVGRRGFSDEVSDWLAPVPANHMPCFGGPLSPIAWDSVWELFGNTSHYEILQTFCKHFAKDLGKYWHFYRDPHKLQGLLIYILPKSLVRATDVSESNWWCRGYDRQYPELGLEMSWVV